MTAYDDVVTTSDAAKGRMPGEWRRPKDATRAAAEAVVAELLYTPQGRSDPYPRYEQLRSLEPAHRSTQLGGWVLVGYADVSAALRDPRLRRGVTATYDRLRPGWRQHPSLTHMATSMLMADGEQHSRLRKAVARAFTPKVVEALRPRVAALAAEVVDPFVEAGGGDIVEAVGFPFPAEVIAALLGVPRADVPFFRHWARALVATLELGSSEEELNQADVADAAMRDYFVELIASKRRAPAEDLLSALVAAEGSEDGLGAVECLEMAILLFVAGFETTTNTIGNAVLAFADQPEQIAILHDTPEHYVGLADELLRYCGPVHLIARRAVEPTVLNGHIPVEEDELVLSLPAAANRDPEQFSSPERLDCARGAVRPVSFGGGLHYCVGAALARLELDLCFRRLLEQVEGIEVTGEPSYLDRLTLFGPRTVPVRLHARATSMRRHAQDQPAVPAGGAGVAGGAAGPAATLGERVAHEARAQAEACPLGPGGVRDGIRDILARTRFFEGASVGALTHLAESAYVAIFHPGETLMAQGAPSPNCYVLAEGQVEVWRAGTHVATLGPGEVVGELGVLLGAPRSASVVARSDVVTWSLSAQRLRDVGQDDPALLQRMHAYAAPRKPVER